MGRLHSKNTPIMKTKNSILFLIYLLIIPSIIAQTTQTIRGKVMDNESEMGLAYANVFLLNTNPPIGVITDEKGRFVLENVELGRIGLKVSYVGYEERVISGILVTSGKELNLQISLKESINSLNEVEVKATERKEEALNQMASVSVRAFSVEEASRFAGGLDDPSRLASSFAGVTPSTVENNEIVIRGNAAKGILWRLEGMEIPAPNHLAGMFSGGGINTMFSTNMLSTSDFFTGAFPAEYGNAMSGVFDMRFRNGNVEKKEYTFQVGTQGIDFSLEGPFKKEGSASYLINYRYSTIGLLQSLMPQVTGLPNYQDLSLKLNFPTKKAGVFSLWSINGSARIKSDMSTDTADWETNMDSYQYDISYKLTSSGITHRIFLNKKAYVFSSFSFSATDYDNVNDYYKLDLQKIPVTNQNEINSSISLSSYINYKTSSRHTNRSGFLAKRLGYQFDIANNTNVAENDEADFFVNSKGNAGSLQLFSQSKFFLIETFNINAGLHLVYFNINNEWIPEPRIGMSWQVHAKHSFSLAYGKHSRIEPLRIYLTEVPTTSGYRKLNKDLNITKTHHFVFSYDWRIGAKTHLTVEPYYQILYDVPTTPDSSFSMINYTSETFFTNALDNSGTGSNIGIDFTLEQFITNGLYYMITASVYESKFKGGDGIERNTRYNQNYVFNILAGKEWQSKLNHTFGINGKFTLLGGKRQSPIDMEKSLENQFVVYDDSRLYEIQLPTSFYIDLGLNYTINRPKSAHSFIIQAKNILMQEENLGHAYNYKTQSIEPYGLEIIYPYISYKIQF
jgi:hypothetical protein